ncbi:MAG: hypothetical protein J3T61_12520, partial [Candidatus Brocadiales bacterium]|nr:hypothetical protein [Candidatus Bathyanammoxibius sp.]
MMMSKPVKIGKHNFPTQKAAKEFTQAILDKWYAKNIKHNNGSFKNDVVLIDDDDDRRFISALFRRHPRYKEKRAQA